MFLLGMSFGLRNVIARESQRPKQSRDYVQRIVVTGLPRRSAELLAMTVKF